MSGECDKCGEHCLDCGCYIDDFEYKSIRIKKPDGTYITGFKIINLPHGEKGEISRFIDSSKKSES